MKKVLIGIVIAIVLIVVVYFVLPEGARGFVDYYKIRLTDQETYSEILAVRDKTKVLNQDTYTYGDILEANVDYEYWTYDEVFNPDGTYTKTITGCGSNLTISYGEGGDSGACQNSKLKMVFVLDSMGGYNLTVYVDGKVLSTDNRNLLLAEMCKLSK